MPAPPSLDDLDIPDRPAVSSEPEQQLLRRRVLLWGSVAAAALLALLLVVLLGGEEEQRLDRLPAEAPLIRAAEEPIKVPPENPGGMQVPNRDVMIYGRLEHEKPDVSPPVERLLPEPEKPLPPPQPVEPLPASRPAAVPEGPTTLLPDDAAVEDLTAEEPAAEEPAVEMPSPPVALPLPPAAPRPARPKTSATTPRPAAPAAERVPPPSAGGGAYQVQLFAGRSRDDAEAAWSALRGRNADLLAGLSADYVRADLGERGTFYRLRAGPIGSDAQARRLCTALSARRVPCLVVRSGG